MVAKIHPYLRTPEDIDIKAGIEFWFTPPPTAKPAKAYKQFLITLSAIFPLTMLVPWLLGPLFAWFPPLGHYVLSHLIVAAVIVALVVYVIMPRYVRLVSKWLFR